MPFIASKLPHGLIVPESPDHAARRITIFGANIGEDLENVSRNGNPSDNRNREHGFGLTELSDADTKAFTDWRDAVTYQNGNKADGKLAHPFPAFENGLILGPFKTRAEAAQEIAALAGAIQTGVEGLVPEKEGTKNVTIEKNKDAGKGQ